MLHGRNNSKRKSAAQVKGRWRWDLCRGQFQKLSAFLSMSNHGTLLDVNTAQSAAKLHSAFVKSIARFSDRKFMSFVGAILQDDDSDCFRSLSTKNVQMAERV
jgi:hypothetical protein